LREETYSAFIHCGGESIQGGSSDVASYPDVASLNVNQLDCCNLLWRSIVCSGTRKTSYWFLLGVKRTSLELAENADSAAAIDTLENKVVAVISLGQVCF
jgi:hypothetical protein